MPIWVVGGIYSLIVSNAFFKELKCLGQGETHYFKPVPSLACIHEVTPIRRARITMVLVLIESRIVLAIEIVEYFGAGSLPRVFVVLVGLYLFLIRFSEETYYMWIYPVLRAPAKSGFVPVCPLTTAWPSATRPRWPSRMPDPATGMFGHFGADRDFAGALAQEMTRLKALKNRTKTQKASPRASRLTRLANEERPNPANAPPRKQTRARK